MKTNSPFHRYQIALEYVPEMKESLKAYSTLRELGLMHCTDCIPSRKSVFLEVLCSPDILGRIVQTLHNEFGCWISTKEI